MHGPTPVRAGEARERWLVADGLLVEGVLYQLVQNRGISPQGLSREELIQRLKEKMLQEVRF